VPVLSDAIRVQAPRPSTAGSQRHALGELHAGQECDQHQGGDPDDAAEPLEPNHQGRRRHVAARQHLGDAANLGAAPGRRDHARDPSRQHRGAGVEHVAPVAERRIGREHGIGLLGGRQGFAGQQGFIDAQLPGAEQAQVGRHQSAGNQAHHIARDQLGGLDPARHAVAQDHRELAHQDVERRGAARRPPLLVGADRGVELEHHEDKAGVGPFPDQERYQGCGQQQIHQRVLELPQIDPAQARALGPGQHIRPIARTPDLDLGRVQTLRPGFERGQRRIGVESMPEDSVRTIRIGHGPNMTDTSVDRIALDQAGPCLLRRFVFTPPMGLESERWPRMARPNLEPTRMPMFYETKDNKHGLPRDPFKSCIVPRPIGWITTMSAAGVVNLAPYSFFNGVCSDPPMVIFANNGPAKDSLVNCEATGEFVANLATWELRDQMNETSAAVGPDIDEFTLAGLETEPAQLVKPPRVKAAPIHLECVYHQTVELPSNTPGTRNAIVLGRVIGVHIKDEVLTDGFVDMSKIKPIARLGYMDYTRVDMVFNMNRPAV